MAADPQSKCVVVNGKQLHSQQTTDSASAKVWLSMQLVNECRVKLGNWQLLVSTRSLDLAPEEFPIARCRTPPATSNFQAPSIQPGPF